MDEDEDISELCVIELLPKLPCLLEEKEENFWIQFFQNPSTCEGIGEPVEIVKPFPLNSRLAILSKLLTKLETESGLQWWLELTKKSRVSIIIFLSEHSNGQRPWSNIECGHTVLKICSEIGKIFANPELIMENSKELEMEKFGLSAWLIRNLKNASSIQDSDLYTILQSLHQTLNKSSWKYFPARAHGFLWILRQIMRPHLAQVFNLVIPTALLFTDDYYDDYKILGVECLSHIINNLDKPSLLQNNWAVVIYDAVERMISDKNPSVIQLAVPVLMKILCMIEMDPNQTSEFTKYDRLLQKILFNMEFGSDLHHKKVWLKLLDDLLQDIGIATIHWSDRICTILKEFTVCNDHTIWTCILKVLSTVIKNTWFHVNCENISEVILRVIFNFSSCKGVTLSEEEQQNLSKSAKYCFQLLENCDGFEEMRCQIDNIIKKGDSVLLHPNFIESLSNINSNPTESQKSESGLYQTQT